MVWVRPWLLVFAALCSVSAEVRISQATIRMPTWAEGPPDPDPGFDVLLPSTTYPAYPYPYRTNFSEAVADQNWRIVTLENEYLRCRVLPDLGGHLYSCLDKLSGHEMFYANPVVRRQAIGLRGSWVAMGIENSFPVGHSLVSTSPAIFATTQNADGSASVWLADIDRQSGMESRVEYVLRPGSTVLEENVWLYNRGAVAHPYIWWADAAIKIEDENTGFRYPMYVTTTHSTAELDLWPVNMQGVDLSTIKNYPDETALFAYGCRSSLRIILRHAPGPFTMPASTMYRGRRSGHGVRKKIR